MQNIDHFALGQCHLQIPDGACTVCAQF